MVDNDLVDRVHKRFEFDEMMRLLREQIANLGRVEEFLCSVWGVNRVNDLTLGKSAPHHLTVDVLQLMFAFGGKWYEKAKEIAEARGQLSEYVDADGKWKGLRFTPSKGGTSQPI